MEPYICKVVRAEYIFMECVQNGFSKAERLENTALFISQQDSSCQIFYIYTLSFATFSPCRWLLSHSSCTCLMVHCSSFFICLPSRITSLLYYTLSNLFMSSRVKVMFYIVKLIQISCAVGCGITR